MMMSGMTDAAERASGLLKTLGHPGRLMILCYLAEDECSVGELAEKLEMPQSALSQHLARMRAEGLVDTRRQSQQRVYALRDGETRELIEALHGIFCGD